MLVVLAILIVVAIAFGVLGVIIKGLFWLFVVGVVLLAISLVIAGIKIGSHHRSRNKTPGPSV